MQVFWGGQHAGRQPWLKRCRRVIWISSTRVYRESDGNWIDEHSALNVDEPQASAMVDAEAAIRRAATATIIRPAGVYGDPEGMLMRRVRPAWGAAGGQYGNRIHREDLARLIVHCLQRDASGHEVPPTLIAADHDTTPTHEIESWLASQLGSHWRGLNESATAGEPSLSERATGADRVLSQLSHLARGLQSRA